jgi:ATP-binding cassette, subfamily B, bacterial
MLVEPGLRGSPGWMGLGIVIQIIGGLCFAAYPFGYRLFTDALLERKSHQLLIAVFVVAGFFVASWVLGYLGTVTGFTVRQRADLYLATRIAGLINRLTGLEHFERPDYLRELQVLEQDRMILAGAPQQVLGMLVIAVRAIAMVILLMTVNRWFWLLPFGALAPFIADSRSVRYRQRIDDELAEDARLTNMLFTIAATAEPAKELRTFGLASEIAGRRRELARRIVKRTTRAGLVAAIAGSIGWLVFAAVFVVLMAVVIAQAIRGHATPGQVLMVVVLVGNVQAQLGLVTASSGQLMRARLTAERFLWLEDQVSDQRDAGDHITVPERLSEGIRFDHVSFTYPGAEVAALEDVDLLIPAGSVVAIVGENGAGKTTITKLLARMYSPSGGEILVDGRPLERFEVDEWRVRIASTFQDFARFQFRAGHAVGIGDLPRMDDDEAALAALQAAGAESVLEKLSGGLDTQLGRYFSGGQDLSGGEWQKIALGRGRMRVDPLLLILDEPTASLDPHAESALFDHYAQAAQGASVALGTITVLVSHRFSTVRMADLIIVIHDGKVAEFGSHRDLIAAGGRYADLFSLQERAYR